MSENEAKYRLDKDYVVTVNDIRALKGASTPHFALQIRNRILKLIADLPKDDLARLEGELEVARLEQLAEDGEARGLMEEGEAPLPSLTVR